MVFDDTVTPNYLRRGGEILTVTERRECWCNGEIFINIGGKRLRY